MPVKFPDPHLSTPEGIVAIGGSLDPDTLLSAYREGIFPWPVEGASLLWFCPPQRGVLFISELHVSRSLARLRKRNPFRFTIDRDFAAVIRGCAEARRPNHPGTWITPELQSAYERLHRMGVAHSVEAWDGDRLVGGIYGVDVDGAFAAESMFYARPNASKLALLHLADHLYSRGLDWIDVQVLSPHIARFGARNIERDRFLELLARTRKRGLELFAKCRRASLLDTS